MAAAQTDEHKKEEIDGISKEKMRNVESKEN